ncbi:hypothetical protein BRYFOR_06283 [Marvinbryantia formatexigens DSM 14469]|uniref:Uncharacterized protein n=1 Tax=Marvinbryantia formatexigens DSM 14469 TaxID=478749 RepID=C6LCD6_9FIRM|nr:hypothetical protein BRYFOR_06283 [Marvinbryantia formatexigens DSM 14469]
MIGAEIQEALAGAAAQVNSDIPFSKTEQLSDQTNLSFQK